MRHYHIAIEISLCATAEILGKYFLRTIVPMNEFYSKIAKLARHSPLARTRRHKFVLISVFCLCSTTSAIIVNLRRRGLG